MILSACVFFVFIPRRRKWKKWRRGEGNKNTRGDQPPLYGEEKGRIHPRTGGRCDGVMDACVRARWVEKQQSELRGFFWHAPNIRCRRTYSSSSVSKSLRIINTAGRGTLPIVVLVFLLTGCVCHVASREVSVTSAPRACCSGQTASGASKTPRSVYYVSLISTHSNTNCFGWRRSLYRVWQRRSGCKVIGARCFQPPRAHFLSRSLSLSPPISHCPITPRRHGAARLLGACTTQLPSYLRKNFWHWQEKKKV